VALGVLGIFVIIIIGALYVALAASTSTLGRQLEDMIQTRNQLEQSNERLRAEIAELKSVPRLLARAQELGFTVAGRAAIEYLVIDGYNPNRAETVIELEPKTEVVATYDESFAGWLQQQWDAFSGQFQSFSSRADEE
jgi:cell division protein FtsL